MSTSSMAGRSAEAWFCQAEAAYLEKHQGCAWCGGTHRVFCQRGEGKLLYHCQACDFHASRDQAGVFSFIPGEDPISPTNPDTMHEEVPGS